jgi:hypothetical protein
MSEYANVGGKRVLICDIEEWLENRGLIAVPRFATEEMHDAAGEPFHAEWKEQRESAERLYGKVGFASYGFSHAIWNAMIAAAPSLSLKSVEPGDSDL